MWDEKKEVTEPVPGPAVRELNGYPQSRTVLVPFAPNLAVLPHFTCFLSTRMVPVTVNRMSFVLPRSTQTTVFPRMATLGLRLELTRFRGHFIS